MKEKCKAVRILPEAVLVVPHLVIHQALTSCIPGPARRSRFRIHNVRAWTLLFGEMRSRSCCYGHRYQ